MKVVGLLSGGKDSCYNLVHCVKNGHEIVAVASLRPPIGKGQPHHSLSLAISSSLKNIAEEIDSYMYQTVGQDAIEVVAAALDLPLIRRVISGTAVEQGSEYGDRKALNSVTGDETEDMYQLLLSVKVSFTNQSTIALTQQGLRRNNFQT